MLLVLYTYFKKHLKQDKLGEHYCCYGPKTLKSKAFNLLGTSIHPQLRNITLLNVTTSLIS